MVLSLILPTRRSLEFPTTLEYLHVHFLWSEVFLVERMSVFAAAFALFALQAASADPLLQVIKNVGNIKCPDGRTCPDGYTCCKRSTGLYGCCGYPNPVCCNSTNSCCPQGNTCDVSAPGTCWMVCQDGSKCPSGNTCCYDPQSQDYVCCPIEAAVCCADGAHCCPSGNTCCYDPQSQHYACCPIEAAVCCADGIHCCPSGYTCDLSKLTCLKGDTKIPLFRKQPLQTESALPKQLALQRKLKRIK